MKKGFKLFISIALPLVAGFTASLFTRPEIDNWYAGLNKPSWTPPNWLFAPAWTTLYLLMGVAFYIVWISNAPTNLKKKAMVLWGMQLVFNFFWSLLFFNQHLMGWAFAEIMVLWLLILATIFAFGRISSLAAWLLVPYISWVSYAALLNYAVWQLNV